MNSLAQAAAATAAVHPALAAPLRWLAWPLGMAVAGAAAWWLAREPALAPALQFGALLAAVGIALLAERLLPFRRRWAQGPASERRIDASSLAVLMALADPLVKYGLLPLIANLASAWFATRGGAGWFPVTWPLPLQLLLAAVVAEFGQYWMHRGAHHFRWMWAAHGFHHNPERLYWLNGFRVNPLNLVWHQLAGLGVLVAIGTPTVVVQMLVIFATVVAVFQHTNADLRFGGWNLVFGTADLHRWHHDAGPGARQVNFGNVLMLWDQLFGTYRRGGAPVAVGVDAGPPRASGYLRGLVEAMRNAYRRQA